MSKAMKRAIIQVISWGVVALGIIIIFSLPGTIEEWGDNRTKTICLALLFLIGFGIDFLLRMFERSKTHGFTRDERDQFIRSKAMYVGFIVLVLYIFILCITLYTKFESAGVLPVGWVWFIAYSAIVVANLSTGICSLIYYNKQGN